MTFKLIGPVFGAGEPVAEHCGVHRDSNSFEYLGRAAGFQETRDVRKCVLCRPHYGRLAVRVPR